MFSVLPEGYALLNIHVYVLLSNVHMQMTFYVDIPNNYVKILIATAK